MKIIYATYIDNQKEINYPLDLLIKEIPNLFVFISDVNELSHFLKTQNTSVERQVIDFKIKSHLDISTAQNKCIDFLFNKLEADFVVWVQADTYITKEGFELIKHACDINNKSICVSLRVRHLKLFHVCHSDYFGVTIIGSKSKERFIGDGAYTQNSGKNQLGSEDCTIDIGYLSVEQTRAHLTRHQTTWGKKESILSMNDKDFTKALLKRQSVEKMITEKDELYYSLIVKMGLVAQYNSFERIAPEASELSRTGRYTHI